MTTQQRNGVVVAPSTDPASASYTATRLKIILKKPRTDLDVQADFVFKNNTSKTTFVN